jgi:ferrous iron transport protein A
MDGKEIPLNRLPLGRKGPITRILNSKAYCRIITLGLIPGTLIKTVSRAPLGDPVVFQVRGHTLAIRGDVAKMVFVNLEG